MYETAPYPDLGAGLKDISYYWSRVPEFVSRDGIRFLDAGCGTGHLLVGVAKRFPSWKCFGLDLSSASLSVASQLASRHSTTNVHLHQGSYLDPLPFDEKFDIIAALGTIHHAADPVAALRNLGTWLDDKGVIFLHLYGIRLDQGRFDIKEMLSIFEPNLFAHGKRFRYYESLVRHISRRRPLWKRVLLASPYEWFLKLKALARNIKRRVSGVSWSPGWTECYTEPDSPWIDHFCHPCERAYEAHDVQRLVESAGFGVVAMIGHGRENAHLIPPEWRDHYDRLGFWDKVRINELLSEGGGSYNMILAKRAIVPA
jgi:SAM-dependent methyltransferase